MLRQANINKRLERELDQLADEIRQLDQFDQSTTLNIHALSCLMRYAACHDPDDFLEWLQSKHFTVNPQIIDRIELFSDLDSMNPNGNSSQRDGVELRVHIFRNGNETFKHSHKQDFITVCFQGSYRYRYFRETPPLPNIPSTYECYARSGGVQHLIDRREGCIEEVIYSPEGQAIPHQGGQLFHEDAAPLFVNANYIHTVEHVSAEPVITFVARRGLCRAETVVLRAEGDEDPRQQNDSPPRPATEDECIQISKDLLKALVKRSKQDSNTRDFTDIQSYKTPPHKLLSMRTQELNAAQQRLLLSLMNVNGIYSIPLLDDEDRCIQLLSAPMMRDMDRDESENPLDHQAEPMVVYPQESLLFAVLGMILNEALVIPIVDSLDRFSGMLTVDDLLEVRQSLGQALFWSLYEAHKHDDDAVGHVHGLLSSLERLKETCLISEMKPSRTAHDLLVHEALTHLDELIWLYPSCDLGQQGPPQRTLSLSDPLSATQLPEAIICPVKPEEIHLMTWLQKELNVASESSLVFEDSGSLWILNKEMQRVEATIVSESMTIEIVLSQLLSYSTPLYSWITRGPRTSLCMIRTDTLMTPHLTRQLLGRLQQLPRTQQPFELDQWIHQALTTGELSQEALNSLISHSALQQVLQSQDET